MDDRLEKALAHANYAVTVNRQKKNMRERYRLALQYSTNGGLFLANAELISFVSVLLDKGDTEAILVDQNENPIWIKDLSKFRDDLLFTYYEATNEFQASYEKLRKARSVKAATNQ